jgi:glycosyltransferase involved in cell wall biosynthesis
MAIDSRPSWFCAQIGAREHYAIPRALHGARKLHTLYTDFWAGSGIRSLLPASGKLSSLATRFHPDLSDAPVHSYNLRALSWEMRLRRTSNPYEGFCDVGRRFASAVRADLKRQKWSSKSAFFAYDTGALEIFSFLREQGVRCILDQMDPGRVEVNLVREEQKQWPGWAADATTDVPDAYFARREQEWELADRVVVNSEFSRQGLIAQGVTPEKVVVLPLCYETGGSGAAAEEPATIAAASFSRQRPLRVLFLGQVILRKGIHYLIEAARLLQNEPVQFEVVGPLGISDEAVASAPPNVHFHGRVNRDQAAAWYRQADLFVLPTLSDGFALTQIEAMAHGLPVIATANCGEVVTDGADGFIVPVRNAEILARTMARYLAEPGLLAAQRIAAFAKSKQFTLDQLTQRLLALDTTLRR